jgi:hypothetical protein
MTALAVVRYHIVSKRLFTFVIKIHNARFVIFIYGLRTGSDF